MKVYYAHPINIYNTKQETRDIDLLLNLGFEVFNPNSPECEIGYKKEGMDYFSKLVDSCDLLAFRGLPDGAIPAGTKKEIDAAKVQNKPIIELPSCIERRELTVEQTREYLTEIGYR